MKHAFRVAAFAPARRICHRRMEICPFVYGRALRPEEFIDRHEEMRRLLGRLVTGQATAVIGQPHIGKTSFLNYLLDKSSRHKIVGNKLDLSIFSYIDSQMLGQSFDQAAFWKHVLKPLTRRFAILHKQHQSEEKPVRRIEAGSAALALKRLSDDDSDFDPTPIFKAYMTAEQNQFGTFTLEQLFTVLGQQGWLFVLILDEFDAILTHPVLNKTEFYGGLRSLASRCSGFTMVIASRHSLERLNHETQAINPHGSPYFNVFTEFRLGPLPETHANGMINTAGERFGSLDRKFITQTSGLHPYLLQTAAAILWELHEEGTKGAERYQCAAEELSRQSQAHFADTWNTWTMAERKVITIIAMSQINGMVGERQFDWRKFAESIGDYSAELRTLKEAGIIVKTGDDSWKITQEAFVWWWADKIRAITRDSVDFDQWLCSQEMDGLFSKEECKEMNEAVKKMRDSLGKGAGILIENFAKGLASGALKAIGMG